MIEKEYPTYKQKIIISRDEVQKYTRLMNRKTILVGTQEKIQPTKSKNSMPSRECTW